MQNHACCIDQRTQRIRHRCLQSLCNLLWQHFHRGRNLFFAQLIAGNSSAQYLHGPPCRRDRCRMPVVRSDRLHSRLTQQLVHRRQHAEQLGFCRAIHVQLFRVYLRRRSNPVASNNRVAPPRNNFAISTRSKKRMKRVPLSEISSAPIGEAITAPPPPPPPAAKGRSTAAFFCSPPPPPPPSA